MHQFAALPAQPFRLPRQHLHVGVGAQHGASGGAVVAGAAEHGQAGHHMIARLDVGDIGADLLDHAGGFVPQHRGQRMRIKPLHEMQVGVAEPGDTGADQHLARSRLLQADVLDDQRGMRSVQNGGLHDAVSFRLLLLSRFCGDALRPEPRRMSPGRGRALALSGYVLPSSVNSRVIR